MSPFPDPFPEAAVGIIAEVAGNLAFLMAVDVAALPPAAERPVVFAVGYRTAQTRGEVWIALGTGPADDAVRNLRGLAPDATVDATDRLDTASELANVIAGNLLPCLFPDGGEFALDAPRVAGAADFPEPAGACLDLGSGVLAVSVVVT